MEKWQYAQQMGLTEEAVDDWEPEVSGKSDREIKRFVAGLETSEEFFFLLDLLMRQFNAFSVIVTNGDITGTFESAIGREPTDDELDMVLRLCEASLEDHMTQHAMQTVYDICLHIAGAEEKL